MTQKKNFTPHPVALVKIKMSGSAKTIAAVATDFWSLVGLPGAATSGVALERLLGGRTQMAKKIFMNELRRGDRYIEETQDVDEAAAMMFRYLRAAQEGTARLNLRLMAKIMRGLSVERPIYADQFLRYADIVASLTREEVILVATLYAKTQVLKDSPRWREEALTLAKDELVPRVFDTDDRFCAVMAAASRTGLVITGGWSDQFCTTPLMDELARLVSFRDALKEEGIEV